MDQTEVTGRVTFYVDGVYRWIYEMDTRDNRFMYRKVMKILLWVAGGIALACLTMGLILGGDALGFMAGLGLGAGALTLLAWAIAYFALTLAGNGRYRLFFEMTKTEVAVLPTAFGQKRLAPAPPADIPLQDSVPLAAEKARIGARKGRTGRGVTPFSLVRRVEPSRDQDVIDLKSPAGGTQVYAPPEDYDFVLRFVRDRCLGG